MSEPDDLVKPLTGHQERRVEIYSAILLGLATLLTAASVYQGALLRTDANRSYAESQSARTRAVEFFELAGQQDAVDTQIWGQLVVQEALGDDEATQTLRSEVMRPEALEAIEVWEGLEPQPVSPFSSENPAYKNADRDEAKAAGADAQAFFETGRDASSGADRATLASVIFAAVLFVAGIGNTFKLYRPKLAVLGVGVALLVVGILIMVFGV